MLKKIILPVAFPVPRSPVTPHSSPLMFARHSTPPTMTLRGSFFHSSKADKSARGMRTRNAFLYILFISSIVLLSRQPQQVPEARDNSKDQKYNRQPGKGDLKEFIQPVAYGKTDESREDQV